MKKTLPILLLFLMLLSAVWGQTTATVTEVTGKVQIRRGAGAWQKAVAGMKLSDDTAVSTGFNSTAVLDLGGSILQVKPLTRMSLEELVETEETISADLFLKVGKVKAEVKSVEGRVLNFKLRSPITTAAVRGTEFEFDGIVVVVTNGEVTITNVNDQSRSAKGGERITGSERELPSSALENQEMLASESIDTSPGGGGDESIGFPDRRRILVTVNWDWL